MTKFARLLMAVACGRLWRVFSAAGLLFFMSNVGAQANEQAVHGADGIFVSADAAIVWAVLKQPAGDQAVVWLRVVNPARKFAYVAIDGVDPFTRKRERVEAGKRLDAELRLSSDRASFSDLPSREVHFYLSEGDWRTNRAALTVYYLGVPDTTPEFFTAAAMDEYFRTVRLVSHRVELKR
jgi:hypothetical protein